MKQQIYVWCSLTFASEAYRKSIEDFKNTLREKYEILDFVWMLDGDASAVYQHDTKCVLECDILIADCSYPSTWLGYEIATAVEHNKKIFLIAHKDATVTRMILGISKEIAEFIIYENLEEIIQYL